jgi:hypothetical protein
MQILSSAQPASPGGVEPATFGLRPQPLSTAALRFVRFAEACDKEAVRILDQEIPDWRARAALNKERR